MTHITLKSFEEVVWIISRNNQKRNVCRLDAKQSSYKANMTCFTKELHMFLIALVWLCNFKQLLNQVTFDLCLNSLHATDPHTYLCRESKTYRQDRFQTILYRTNPSVPQIGCLCKWATFLHVSLQKLTSKWVPFCFVFFFTDSLFPCESAHSSFNFQTRFCFGLVRYDNDMWWQVWILTLNFV